MKRFQEGDRVFDIRYGWGTVVIFDGDYDVAINFDNETHTRYFDGRGIDTISFTEYTLDGYTHERPKVTWGSIYVEWSYDDSDLKYREYLEQNFEPPIRKCK
jgi:hypothetical protein